jgi:hypothetical protein
LQVAAVAGHTEMKQLLRQEIQRAVEQFTAAINNGGSHRHIYYQHRGHALMAQGETEKAQADFAEAERLRAMESE